MVAQAGTAGRTIVVTGADAGFFGLMEELIASIRGAAGGPPVDLGCYDLGLTEAQAAQLERDGVRAVVPITGLDSRGLAADRSKLGYLARPFLRENFPGYDTYVWLDADTWVQSGEALRGLVDAAQAGGAAFVREDEPSYQSNLGLFLWKGKHYLLGYGPWRATRLLLRRQINNGVFAMRADAPHWGLWQRAYQAALLRTGLAAPHDQFALNAVAYLDKPPSRFLPATFNWICDLSRPDWDDAAQCFCTPDPQRQRIEVIHLAGPIKQTTFDIRTTDGGTLRGTLRHGAERTRLPAPRAHPDRHRSL